MSAAAVRAHDKHREAAGLGTSESHWAEWLPSVPTLVPSGLMQAGARLVVVAPHPEDEVLAGGGLLAQHVADDGEACVIAVTHGEASHAGGDFWTPESLAERRRLESACGLQALGLSDRREVTRLGFPDGAVARYAEPLREALSLSLRPTDLVVTTWRFDGDPDHEAVGAAVEQVCADAGAVCLQAPVWMWHWSRIGDTRVPWHRLRSVALTPTALERKRAALSAHATQLLPRGERQGPVLTPLNVSRAARPAEYFFVQT